MNAETLAQHAPLLRNKVAVIYGAGGAIGGAIARAFAREGAKVFATGRAQAAVASLARDVVTSGGFVEAAEVDALDENAVDRHLASWWRRRVASISRSTQSAFPISRLSVCR
jgi:NAD(P)-dependent dehydrogenase (short-subunit alcohol dehydrogenase family)